MVTDTKVRHLSQRKRSGANPRINCGRAVVERERSSLVKKVGSQLRIAWGGPPI